METCGPPQIQNTMMNQTKYPGESAYFRCQVKLQTVLKYYSFTLKYSFSWAPLTIFFYFFIYLLTYFIKWWFKRSILLEKMRYICIQPSLPLSACFACWFQMIPSHEKNCKELNNKVQLLKGLKYPDYFQTSNIFRLTCQSAWSPLLTGTTCG